MDFFILQIKNDEPDGTNGAKPSMIKDVSFMHAFVASFSVIIVSELGDKTFFIAAIMAMKHPRITIFSGAIFALGLMTVLSGKCTFTLIVYKTNI